MTIVKPTTSIADHAQRRQEAYVERRRCRVANAVQHAAEEAGFNCPLVMQRFLVLLIDKLDLDTK